MIQGKILSINDDLTEVFRIRKEVFVDELGVPEVVEFDHLDNSAMHVLVYDNDVKYTNKDSGLNEMYKIAVATGRIIYDGDLCIIDHVAVLKAYRKNGYGDFAVRMLLNRAIIAGIDKVVINTKPELYEFFNKIGFEILKKEYENNAEIWYNMIINVTNLKTRCKK